MKIFHLEFATGRDCSSPPPATLSCANSKDLNSGFLLIPTLILAQVLGAKARRKKKQQSSVYTTYTASY